MTFGRWLLIHSFSIFLVTLLILGYIYREELKLEQAYQQLLNLEPEKVTITSVSPDQTKKPMEPEPPAKTTTEKIDKTTELSEPAKTIDPLPEISSVPTVSEPVIQQDQRLLMARKAYWDKNYQQAIRYYQLLIQENPRNPDYFGELGNIYYALNDDQNASKAYYQAAMILLEQNQNKRAAILLSPITAMDRSLGDKLRQKLQ